MWVLREEFSSELAGKQEVYQQELTAWKERERRRVSERGWEEERGEEGMSERGWEEERGKG